MFSVIVKDQNPHLLKIIICHQSCKEIIGGGGDLCALSFLRSLSDSLSLKLHELQRELFLIMFYNVSSSSRLFTK